jgi:guanine nucleotide-binding protein subunit alpha
MGCCSSIEASHHPVGQLRDQEIDEQLKKDRHKLSHQVKLLLLGKKSTHKQIEYKPNNVFLFRGG